PHRPPPAATSRRTTSPTPCSPSSATSSTPRRTSPPTPRTRPWTSTPSSCWSSRCTCPRSTGWRSPTTRYSAPPRSPRRPDCSPPRACAVPRDSPRSPEGAAFFDVDGTLTTGTTLFRFLRYRFAAEGRPPQDYTQERQRLRAMTEAGVSRTHSNRAYFASYAHLNASYVAELAEEWFSAELETGGFLHDVAVAELRRHQAAGEPVVLVSGSFPALLAPLARLLGVDAVLATEPGIVLGHYTGDAALPMIGAAKADAVRSWAAGRGIDLSAATAYGDHVWTCPCCGPPAAAWSSAATGSCGPSPRGRAGACCPGRLPRRRSHCPRRGGRPGRRPRPPDLPPHLPHIPPAGLTGPYTEVLHHARSRNPGIRRT